MKENTIILEGGLGNRMRVAAAAYAMARRTGVPMRVLWTSQWGMRCRFDELFEDSPPALTGVPLSFKEGVVTSEYSSQSAANSPSPIGEGAGVRLRDAKGFEKLLFARPTWKNLHLPKLLQKMCYRQIILAPQIWYLNKDGFDYERWFRQGGTLMTSYRDFCPWTTDDLHRLFRPNAKVRQLVNVRKSAFSPYTIGLHIRRTDHQQAIDESPLELFTDAIDREAEAHADLRIYLATDDEATKAALFDRYGDRILTSPAEATRESANGIREALVEMLTLSCTQHIYGSAGSTFSPIAACLGDVPITILQRDGKGEIDLLCQDFCPT